MTRDSSGSLLDQITVVSSDDQVAAAAAITARAFTVLEASKYLVPDPDQRTRILTDVFTIDFAHAREYGVAYLLELTSGHGGASAWIDMTGSPVPTPEDYSRRLDAAAGPFAGRFRELDRLFTQNHPVRPHYHLALHAADPQGTGIGRALLQQHQPVLDKSGWPAYLEAASPEAARFYDRKGGYQETGHTFSLPNGATFIPMWRHPRPEGW